MFFVEVLLNQGRGVEALCLEYVGDVAAGENDDGVAAFADFGVSLGVQMGCGDQDPELAVAQPGDQAAGFADADAVTGCIAPARLVRERQ